ncbi:mitochondrial Complex I, subunit 3 -like protein [Reticulomyxa filosa]|uniref:Mitochondrial Complex I, subunit 3-like protein n=1 Tax=Reticulomyxa filosa TaxID=46433 RepID=X6MR49_RETFI|nr:mitochondrial Complex I, subunit 3 -like protein [Reticulomyxa filosa]|eukprot:ETO15580.1 mitochondrial Complex I, subunit 3 -like protein [Reticulomyxa filosa]
MNDTKKKFFGTSIAIKIETKCQKICSPPLSSYFSMIIYFCFFFFIIFFLLSFAILFLFFHFFKILGNIIIYVCMLCAIEFEEEREDRKIKIKIKMDNVDEKELEDLIYVALCFFCTERDPDMPQPPREQCEPFVKKILQDLKPNLDENDDGVISREEFELFGKYLNQEYSKLKSEINEDKKNKGSGK